jgi:uncharacterized protein (TIGR02597 family)
MKPILPLILLLGALAPAGAQDTATSPVVGYSTITVPGNGALTALSVTFNKPVEYAGVATSFGATGLTCEAAAWTDSQWVGKLACIENAGGAEEAFLITANTATALTLTSSFSPNARYAANAKFTIKGAHTVGSLFGTTGAEVVFQSGDSASADILYLWDGTQYVQYYHNGTNWRRSGTLSTAANDVVFPDDGFFVLRRAAASLALTFSGEIPQKAQTTTIPGGAQTTVASRFPVDTTILQMGFQSLPGWLNGTSSTGDRVYLWENNAYTVFWWNGTNWRKSGSLSAADTAVIPANSFMFVVRESAGTAAGAAAVHTLPYGIN